MSFAQKVFPKFLYSGPNLERIVAMEAVDRKILAELQRDGRLTITELADRVRLSVSPCHRRLRALENSGAISGYRAQLDAHALGLTFEALVFVDDARLRPQHPRRSSNNRSLRSRMFFKPNGYSATPTISCVSSRAI